MCLNKCLFVDKLGHLWVRILGFSWNRLLAIPKAIFQSLSVDGKWWYIKWKKLIGAVFFIAHILPAIHLGQGTLLQLIILTVSAPGAANLVVPGAQTPLSRTPESHLCTRCFDATGNRHNETDGNVSAPYDLLEICKSSGRGIAEIYFLVKLKIYLFIHLQIYYHFSYILKHED